MWYDAISFATLRLRWWLSDQVRRAVHWVVSRPLRFFSEPACPTCDDTGSVCEDHPDRPWGGFCCATHACNCGGAGMPCPKCCDPAGVPSRADGRMCD